MSAIRLTPKALALELGVSDKSLRSAMRRLTDERATSGGRWDIGEEMEASLRAHFGGDTNRGVKIATPKVPQD